MRWCTGKYLQQQVRKGITTAQTINLKFRPKAISEIVQHWYTQWWHRWSMAIDCHTWGQYTIAKNFVASIDLMPKNSGPEKWAMIYIQAHRQVWVHWMQCWRCQWYHNSPHLSLWTGMCTHENKDVDCMRTRHRRTGNDMFHCLQAFNRYTKCTSLCTKRFTNVHMEAHISNMYENLLFDDMPALNRLRVWKEGQDPGLLPILNGIGTNISIVDCRAVAQRLKWHAIPSHVHTLVVNNQLIQRLNGYEKLPPGCKR